MLFWVSLDFLLFLCLLYKHFYIGNIKDFESMKTCNFCLSEYLRPADMLLHQLWALGGLVLHLWFRVFHITQPAWARTLCRDLKIIAVDKTLQYHWRERAPITAYMGSLNALTILWALLLAGDCSCTLFWRSGQEKKLLLVFGSSCFDT